MEDLDKTLEKRIKIQLDRIAKITSKIETTNNPIGYKPTHLYKPIYDDVVEKLKELSNEKPSRI